MKRGRGEQIRPERSHKPRILRPHRAFHFVKHDPFILQSGTRVFGLGEFKPVPFLFKVLFFEFWEENCV